MKDINKIIKIWGLFDLCAIVWYVGWRIFHGQIPFISDMQKGIETTSSFGLPSLSVVTIIAAILYLSLIPSGIYLLRQNKIGAIMTYVQTPFRLLTFIPPSIFFLLWPLPYIFKRPSFVVGIALLLVSETLKLITVIKWHKTIKNV